MKLIKTAIAVCCIALAAAALAPSVNADMWDKKSIITFSGPVEIPGVHLKGWGVLPAGTYTFKLLDSNATRHIVQIFDKEGKTIYATILAIPNEKMKTPEKTEMTFFERAAGQPQAIRAWFYPGNNFGEEFVYSKVRAAELAKAAEAPVPFTPQETPVEVSEPIKPAEPPVVAQMQKEPVQVVTPAGKEEPLPPPPAAAAPAPVEVAAAPVEKLPETASPLPLMALLGLVSLGGAIGVKKIEKQIR